MDETGLPGRPITSIGPRRPCISGLPGRSATRQNPSPAPPVPGRLNEVVIPHGGATEGDEQVGLLLSRPAEGGFEGGVVVGGDAEVDDLRTGLLGQGREGEAVRGDNLVPGWGGAGLDQFVARARIATLGRRRTTSAGWPAAAASAKRRASRVRPSIEQPRPLLEIEPFPADEAVRLYGLPDSNRIALGLRVLLDQDRIGPLGHRGAGEFGPLRPARPGR